MYRTSRAMTIGCKILIAVLTIQFSVVPLPASAAKSSSITVDQLLGKEAASASTTSAKPVKPVKSATSGKSTDTSTDTSTKTLTATSSTMTLSTMSVSTSGGANSPQSAANYFHFDPTSGAGVISLPIETPAGRSGVKPNLVLSYSPRSGNGPFGTGWGMDFGFIERSTKNGVPGYTDSDTFIMSLGSGAMELVSIGSGKYRTKQEAGFFLIKKEGDAWTVKDRSGTTYYFGLSAFYTDQSRPGPTTGNAFRWHLSKIKDVSGNYYFIRHLGNGAFEIYYTGEPGTDAAGVNVASQKLFAKVVTVMETTDRTDRICSRRGKFLDAVRRRVKEILVYAGGSLQKRYVFAYDYSDRSGRSLLSSLTEYGADGTTAMPAVNFSYEQTPVGYSLVSQTGNPLTGDNRWAFRHNAGWDISSENFGAAHPSMMLPLSDPIVQSSWTGAGSWTQDNYGRIELWGVQDVGYYFYTYLYTDQPVTLTFAATANDWDPGVWLNGTLLSSSSWNLQAGYNLVEYTDYNQNQSFHAKFLNTISDKVDIMNSVQLVLPQMSADFNGDGLTDLATYFSEEGKIKVEVSTGSAFLPKATWLTSVALGVRPLIGDVNADGKTDLVLFDPAAGTWKPALSDGTKFVTGATWLTGFGTGTNVVPMLAEINGDGKLDAVTITDASNQKTLRAALNTGSAFVAASGQVVVGTSAEQIFGTDIEGDGLTDFGVFTASSGQWKFFNNTNGTVAGMTAGLTVSGFGMNKAMVAADVNGDGTVDIGYFDNAAGSAVFRYSRSESVETTNKPLPFTFNLKGSDVQLQTGDFNGDGVVDFIAYNQVGNLEIAYSDGKVADVLTQVNNGRGGLTTIAYVPSLAFQNTYLPFVLPLVERVTVSNQRDYSVTTRYWYEGGLWKPADREFYGFAKVRVYDADNNFSETEFLQSDYYLRGRPSRSRFVSFLGQELKRSENQWVIQDVVPAVNTAIKFVYLKRADSFEYDTAGNGKRVAVENFYEESPQYGNLTKSVDYGEVNLTSGADVGTDKRWTETQYANNITETVWILGAPVHQYVYVQGQTGDAGHTTFFYDSLALGQVGTYGRLTKKVTDNAGFTPASISQEFVYDTYGNLVQTKNPNGYLASVTFDTDYHLAPVQETNPLNQKVTKQYYGIGGVSQNSGDGYAGRFGQVKTVTDPNGVSERYTYDIFGRLSAVVGPRDSLTYPTLRTQYDILSGYTRVSTYKRREHGTTLTVKSVQFVDGLGRMIQAKNPSGKPGVFVVSGETQTDARGLVVEQFVPRQAVLAQDQLETRPSGALSSVVQYDVLGRPVRSENPDGTFSTSVYGLWTVSSIDPNGHKQAAYVDVRGQTIRREEFSGADGRSSDYPSSAFQVYATTQYGYDLLGRLIRTVDARGNTCTISYDRLGRKISMDDPDMGAWQYGYDANGNLLWQIDARGKRLDFQYDALNRLVHKTDGADIDVVYTYDLNAYGIGRLSQVEYGATSGNDLTQFTYDEFGREIQALKVIDGIGYYTSRDYDAMNNLKAVTYPDTNSIYYHYDEAGRLDKIANDDAIFDQQSLMSPKLMEPKVNIRLAGELIPSESEGSKPAHLAQGYLSSREEAGIDFAMPRWRKVAHAIWKGVKAAGAEIAAVFLGTDAWAGQAAISFSVPPFVEADPSNKVSVTPACVSFSDIETCTTSSYVYKPHVTAGDFVYEFDTKITSSDVFSGETLVWGLSNTAGKTFNKWTSGASIGWYVGGSLIQLRLFKGAAHVNSSSNLKLNVLYHVRVQRTGKVYKISIYDNNNVLVGNFGFSLMDTLTYNYLYAFSTKLTSGTGHKVTGQVCNLKQEVANQAPVVSAVSEQQAVTDQLMQVDIVATDADQDTISLAPGQSTLPEGATLTTVSSTAGRLEASLTWEPQRSDIGDHTVVVAVSDGVAQATRQITVHVARGVIVEDAKLYVSSIEYNVMGQTSKIMYGTGTVKEYFYDELTFRLQRLLTLNAAGTPIQDLNYFYDAAGNITAVTDNVNSATQVFSYDHLNRLVGATDTATYGTKTYQYDETGNILAKDGKTYTYGQNNAGPHAVTSLSNGASFGYDANGNMTSRNAAAGNFAYTFDAENRLAAVAKAGTAAVDFRYDGDGGRTKKVAYGVVSGVPISALAYPELLTGGAGADDLVTHFIGSLYEVDTLHEVKHVYLGNERILSVRDGVEQYIHGDHLGSSNVVEDQNGDLVQINEYEPFGGFSRRDSYTEAGQESDLYFTQQILDDETGLYYYGARYYDPAVGRFISADPTVQHPNDPQDLNRYAYTRNNPINLIDPTGYGWVKDFFRKADDILDDCVEWLEKATGSEWVIDAEFGYSYQTNRPVSEPTTVVIRTAFFIPLGFYSFWYDGLSGRNADRRRSSLEDILYASEWRLLGIGTTDEKAEQDAKKNNAVALYVNSRGILADFVRAGLKKFFGGGKAGSELADYMKSFEGSRIFAHSEGTLTLAGAIQELNWDNFSFEKDIKISWNGPVIMKSTAQTLSKSVKAFSDYHLNFADPIGVFTTPDPVKIGIYGTIGTATGFKFHGTDYYAY